VLESPRNGLDNAPARRFLRDIAEGRVVCDTATLTDSTVLSDIKRQYEETDA
jgi:acetyl-CoA synthetase